MSFVEGTRKVVIGMKFIGFPLKLAIDAGVSPKLWVTDQIAMSLVAVQSVF